MSLTLLATNTIGWSWRRRLSVLPWLAAARRVPLPSSARAWSPQAPKPRRRTRTSSSYSHSQASSLSFTSLRAPPPRSTSNSAGSSSSGHPLPHLGSGLVPLVPSARVGGHRPIPPPRLFADVPQHLVSVRPAASTSSSGLRLSLCSSSHHDHPASTSHCDVRQVTAASGSTSKSGQAVWTTSMTNMMMGILADMVASGKRTSSGFKKCHHNQCATTLNDHFKLAITGDQVSNHLKKWRKIWGRIVQLKNLSGALWDEDTCTIRLSDEHYVGHCKDHKSNVNYLNTPIEHYRAMETMFGTTTATGQYARFGNDVLSIDIDEENNGEVNVSPNVGESSSSKGPKKKKAKVVHIEDDALVTTLKDGFKLVAEALVKSGGDDDTIPDGLWDDVSKINGFDEGELAHYYAHLVENPKIAKAFLSLSISNKLVWVSRYVTKNFG